MAVYALEVDVNDFTDQMMIALASHLNKAFKTAVKPIEYRMRNEVKVLLEQSPEYQSLLSGPLQGELGLKDATSVLPSITKLWLNSIEVSLDPIRAVGKNLYGGLQLVGIRASYDDVLNHAKAAFISEGGFVIFWLGWLLSEGTRIIVKDHRIRYGPYKASRTGKAIMTQSGKGWRVPPEYAGTVDNNFVTRALEGVDSLISRIFEEEIERRL